MRTLSRMVMALVAALFALHPAAEAATCKGGKRADNAGRCKATPTKKALTKTKAKAGKRTKAVAAVQDKGALYVFIESRGCRLLATESSVRRMQEIAVGGSVTWDGRCAEGLISGTGVLRQEGVFIEGGRSKHFAYYYSGRAKNGVRTGQWTRESLERFDDSARSWTSLARVEFVNGVAKGAPKPIPVRGVDQHSRSFTTRVLDPEAKRAQAVSETTPPVADSDALRLRAAPSVAAAAPTLAPTAPSPSFPAPAVSALPAQPKVSLPAGESAPSPTARPVAPKPSIASPAPPAVFPAPAVPSQPAPTLAVAAPSQLAASQPTPPSAVAPAPTPAPALVIKAPPQSAAIPQTPAPPAPPVSPKSASAATVSTPPTTIPEPIKAAAVKLAPPPVAPAPSPVPPTPTSAPPAAIKVSPSTPAPQTSGPPAQSVAPKPVVPATVAVPAPPVPEPFKAAAIKLAPPPVAPAPTPVPPTPTLQTSGPPTQSIAPKPVVPATVTVLAPPVPEPVKAAAVKLAPPAVAPAPTPAPAAVPKAPPAAAPVAPAAATQTAPPKPVAVVAPPPPAAAKLTPALPEAMEKQAFGFGTGCYMDTLDGQLWESAVLAVKDRKSLRIDGWAVDDEERVLAEATYLRLEGSNGRRYYAATTVQDRPDVARHFGIPIFVKAGYRAAFSTEGLPAGEYEATIVMNSKGRNVLCGNGRRLKL